MKMDGSTIQTGTQSKLWPTSVGLVRSPNPEAQTRPQLRHNLAFPVETLHRYLQKLLSDFQVEWMVAPYSAAAQVCLQLPRKTELANPRHSYTTSKRSKMQYSWNTLWDRLIAFS